MPSKDVIDTRHRRKEDPAPVLMILRLEVAARGVLAGLLAE